MKFRSLLYLAISIGSLILQIILAKQYGVMGCAIAIGGALLLGQGLIMNIYYNKRQYIDIPKFWIEIIKIMILPTILTLAGLITLHYVHLDKWVLLLSGVFIFTFVYFPLLFKFSMNTSERQLIAQPLHSLFNKILRKA